MKNAKFTVFITRVNIYSVSRLPQVNSTWRISTVLCTDQPENQRNPHGRCIFLGLVINLSLTLGNFKFWVLNFELTFCDNPEGVLARHSFSGGGTGRER